jgi:integrase
VGSFDFTKGTVTVSEQVIRGTGGRPTFGPPKSKAGHRTLQVPQELVDLVREHLKRFKIASNADGALVLTNRAGGPLDYSHFRQRVWKPAATAAGVPDAGFHDLRRTIVTALVTANVDMKTAKDRLGHSDARLTLAVYAQATSEADQVAAERLGSKFCRRAPQVIARDGDLAVS